MQTNLQKYSSYIMIGLALLLLLVLSNKCSLKTQLMLEKKSREADKKEFMLKLSNIDSLFLNEKKEILLLEKEFDNPNTTLEELKKRLNENN